MPVFEFLSRDDSSRRNKGLAGTWIWSLDIFIIIMIINSHTHTYRSTPPHEPIKLISKHDYIIYFFPSPLLLLSHHQPFGRVCLPACLFRFFSVSIYSWYISYKTWPYLFFFVQSPFMAIIRGRLLTLQIKVFKSNIRMTWISTLIPLLCPTKCIHYWLLLWLYYCTLKVAWPVVFQEQYEYHHCSVVSD